MSWAFATVAAALAGTVIWGSHSGRTIENIFLGATAATVILRLAGF